jgi:transposase InsO family protein
VEEGGAEGSPASAEARTVVAWATDPVFDFVLSIRITFGAMISCMTVQGMGGRPGMLTILDEYSRECLAIDVRRKFTHDAVLHRLTDLFFRRGIPERIRSDNGAEFTAKAVRTWLSRLGVRTLYVEPGSPWENGYIESFNGKLRDEVFIFSIVSKISSSFLENSFNCSLTYCSIFFELTLLIEHACHTY